LSDLICERAGLQRHQLGNELNTGKMSLAAAGRLVAARHHVRFKLAELPDLGIDPISLAPFLFTPSGRALLLSQTIGNSDLERHPLVRNGTYLYVVLPTAISIAIRTFVIQRMSEAGMRDAFCRGLANVYARTLQNLPLLGARRGPAINFQPGPHAAITQVGIEFDVGRFIQLLFFTDNLRDFEETGFTGLNPDTMELDRTFSEYIAAFQKHAQQSEGYRGGQVNLRRLCQRQPRTDFAHHRNCVKDLGASRGTKRARSYRPLRLFRFLEPPCPRVRLN